MGSVQAEDEVLGFTKIGGTEVPIIAPNYEGDPYVGPFKIGSEPYVQLTSGTCDRLARIDIGRWMKQRHPLAQANLAKGNVPEWRIKVIVFTRADHATLNSESAWRMFLEEPEITFIKKQLALIEAFVEDENYGNVNLVWEYSEAGVPTSPALDEDKDSLARTAPLEDSSGTVTPAIHGVLRVQADGRSFGTSVGSDDSSPCPSEIATLDPQRDDIKRLLRLYPGVPKWLPIVDRLLTRRANWLGFKEVGGVRCESSFWKEFCSTGPFTSQQYLGRLTKSAIFPESWAEAKNFVRKERPPTGADLLRIPGSDQILDVVQELAKDSVVNLHDQEVWVDGIPLDQLIRKLAGPLEPNARAQFGDPALDDAFGTRVDRGPENLQFIIFPPIYKSTGPEQAISLSIGDRAEVEVYAEGWTTAIKIGGSKWQAEKGSNPKLIRYKNLGSSSWIIQQLVPATNEITLVASEGLEYKSTLTDTEKGPGIRVELKGARPLERIPLAKSVIAHMPGKVLEFWVKTDSAVPFKVLDRTINFFPVLLDQGRSERPSAIRLESDSTTKWTKYAISTNGFNLLGLEPVIRNLEGYDVGNRQITLAGFRIVEGEIPEFAQIPNPYANSTVPELAKALQETAGNDLRFALKRVRSLMFPMRIPGSNSEAPVTDPILIPGLKVAAKSGDHWSALAALDALMKLGGTDAETALRYGIVFGPFDHNRLAAISVIPTGEESKFVSELSSTVTSQDVRVRSAATWTLAQARTDEANIALLVMLRDPEVRVRLVAATGINAAHPLGARRLLYAAVNDPNESVRAAAYESLIKASATEETLQEAYKGIKDDAFTVRVAVLDAMASKPNINQRQAISLALSDPWPWVRAAAVRALTKQPGEVSEKEVEHLVLDPFPEIRKAMQELAKAKGLSFAWD